ncbi:MAG TPA: flagellar biosynthesis protein FlhF [Steroidobacteraceae bacterium]|nr:flagellar biosynthesis protein FlhF [Steroidobacteraceae bacterium]
MKIRRFVASEMRQALKQVRDELGPDAVILHTRRIGEEVEVVSAIDFDPENLDSADLSRAGNADAYDFAGILRRTRDDEMAATGKSEIDALALSDVDNEIHALRRMLETQLAALAWNDLTRRAPVHTEVLKAISALGVTVDIAALIVSQLPARVELAEAQRLALALFAQRIPTTKERWLEEGGTVAMIGPTGVGKTSAIAKLAARWVLHHGARNLALVCADNTRIGAHEHLQSIGRLLGVPCFSAETPDALPALLQDLEHRKLVLIDTAGMGQRDTRLADELQNLVGAHRRLETALVLSASSQAGAIEETIQAFAAAKPASCLLTKLDEAASLGGVLSAVARAQIAIAYVSEGQQVAEDLHPARGHRLVARAVLLSKVAGAAADEDLLKRRFGGIAHGIA